MNIFENIVSIGLSLLFFGVIIAIVGAALKSETQRINQEKINQTEGETQIQQEHTKPIEKMTKTKILGALLLICTTFELLFNIYTSGFSMTIFGIFLFVFTYIVGIALIMNKKRGTYHTLIVICGIILLALYLLLLLTDTILLIMNSS